MAKKNSSKGIEELAQAYVKVREEIAPLEKEKKTLSEAIKALIGDRTAVPSEHFRISYGYDKDKEVTTFDEESFAKKDPAKYRGYLKAVAQCEALRKKYVKTETVPGARKLNIERLDKE